MADIFLYILLYIYYILISYSGMNIEGMFIFSHGIIFATIHYPVHYNLNWNGRSFVSRTHLRVLVNIIYSSFCLRGISFHLWIPEGALWPQYQQLQIEINFSLYSTINTIPTIRSIYKSHKSHISQVVFSPGPLLRPHGMTFHVSLPSCHA